MFSKTDVNGENAHEAYKFMTHFIQDEQIQWNFEKFLVDGDGEVILHFESDVNPLQIEPMIVAMLY